MKRPVITLLTDFGLSDHYVAAMKGIILGICPQAEMVDISHEITPFAITEGAYTLAQAWHCFPKGTVHVAVVDPGVGGTRRAIVAEAGGHRFVAPDNGLLSLALGNQSAVKVREITAVRYFRPAVSRTFHGRDIFAPVAAHLANGLAPGRLGKRVIDFADGGFARPTRTGPSRWSGTILKIDRFGNVITNLDWDTFGEIAGSTSFLLKIGRRTISRFYATYAEAPAGQLFALKGSSGYVEVSLNQSSAAVFLKALPGAAIEIQVRSTG